MVSESDWKKFKKVKESALERFCETILKDIEEGLSKTNSSNHGKYLYLHKLIENYDKQIALLFNDHSRSKAVIQLMMLRRAGLVGEEDIRDISDEFKKQTDPQNYS